MDEAVVWAWEKVLGGIARGCDPGWGRLRSRCNFEISPDCDILGGLRWRDAEISITNLGFDSKASNDNMNQSITAHHFRKMSFKTANLSRNLQHTTAVIEAAPGALPLPVAIPTSAATPVCRQFMLKSENSYATMLSKGSSRH